MNHPRPLRLALGVAPALLAMSFALAGTGGVQFSQTPVGLPTVAAPAEPPWPAVDWGFLPLAGGQGAFGWPDDGEMALDGEDGLPLLTGAFVQTSNGRFGNVALNAPPGGWLGPVDDFLVPVPAGPTASEPHPTETALAPARIQLGNVSFNSAAASLNVQKVDLPKADDLSRQFEPGVAVSNVAPAVPLTGWTMIAIAALAIIIALAISFHQNDSRKRKHKHRRRHHRRSSREA